MRIGVCAICGVARVLLVLMLAGQSVSAASNAARGDGASEGVGLVHPFHETLTQIEQNIDDNTLEVAIRIDALDLDQMIERWLGERIDIEHDPRAERSLELWLRERLGVRLAGGERAPMTWIGHEFEGPFCWMYVEYSVDRDEPFVDLAHLVLFDWHPGPVNRIVGVGTLRGVSLATTPEHPIAHLRLLAAPRRTPLRVLVDLFRDLWLGMRLAARGL